MPTRCWIESKKRNLLEARAVFTLLPANSKGDDLLLFENEKKQKMVSKFSFLRQQEKFKKGLSNLCLSDFIAPLESGRTDYVGAFVTTAGNSFGREFEKWNCKE